MVKIKNGCRVNLYPKHTHTHTHMHPQTGNGRVGDFDTINFKLHFIFIVDLLQSIQVLCYIMLIFNFSCKSASHSFLIYVINIRIIRSALRSGDCG